MPLTAGQTYAALSIPRPRHRHRHRPMRLGLTIVPLIDVVFLLLVFFLLTANFRSREAFLPAQLPRQTVSAEQMEIEPLIIHLSPLPDGACRIRIGAAAEIIISSAPGGSSFTDLAQHITEILQDRGRTTDDPVKLVPDPSTKWDHVVKTYDALWRLNLTNIIFAFVEG
jgi:biopolymer transport protein ExbD